MLHILRRASAYSALLALGCSGNATPPAMQDGQPNRLFLQLAESVAARTQSPSAVSLVAVQPRGAPGSKADYVIVMMGIAESTAVSPKDKGELYVVAVANHELNQLVQILGTFPTPRVGDYFVWLEPSAPDSVVVKGRGLSYGDNPIRLVYPIR